MLFKAPVLTAIAEGQVTLAFRRWRKPTVRTGGTLTTPVGVLAIEAVDIVTPDSIDEAQARAAGYASRAALLADLTGEPPLYRIAFRRAADDPRKALRLDTSDTRLEAVEMRLARLDAKAPWTAKVLDLIAENPGLRAPDLAARLGRETLPFKADVRKLKALGLTESLEVGYRLSPRGQALLARRLQPRSAKANAQG
ncbi:MAG: hypothetical protein V4514_08740 [Pseudomonadota bacterium]|uniref:hypothetical protein n=1 Tax=Phenylobacterium sp. TaxID=1871053 RepID=UPI0025E2CE87|nr:hypothetical protein [Phenylobacterium sp.]MBT9471040.1 hypothetical protein [Phenylobacterium sp.]